MSRASKFICATGTAPDPNISNVPGEWRAEKSWPPRDATKETLFLERDHTLGSVIPASRDVSQHKLKYVPSIGGEAGFWWGDFATDQRPTDSYTLVSIPRPFENDTAVLGRPRATLHPFLQLHLCLIGLYGSQT